MAEQFGAAFSRVRFSESFEFVSTNPAVADARLVVFHRDGRKSEIRDLASRQLGNNSELMEQFSAMIAAEHPGGHLLEVGSRARSGNIRRNLIPEGWQYTGLDVLPGPNVDIVGDVHEISGQFAAGSFHAVMAFSVLEHLLMPWKAIIELNAVLAPGAIGLFTTHQCWPLHEVPWDFWRFSDRAWDGLLNKATGFEIIRTVMSEPAFLVAERCHAVTNFGFENGGFLSSSVIFRKIGNTSLTWPVTVADATPTQYPVAWNPETVHQR